MGAMWHKEDGEGGYLARIHYDYSDMCVQLFELAPKLQLDVHLAKDTIFFFEHAEVGRVIVEIRWLYFVWQRWPQLVGIRSLHALRSSELSNVLGHIATRLSMLT